MRVNVWGLLIRELTLSLWYQSIGDTFVQLFHPGTSGLMTLPQSSAVQPVRRKLKRAAISERRVGWRSQW